MIGERVLASLRQILESMDAVGRDFWDDPAKPDFDERVVTEFIKRGLEIRPERDDGKSFWDDFLLIFGQNPDGGAELFGVREESISRATTRVRKLVKEISQENDQSGKRKKRVMLHTGI